MRESKKTRRWTPPREITVADRFDVVVVGGGIAGISAAIAASRCGARVCLVEREYMAGGLATLGLVWCYLPLCDGMGNQVVSGIPEELMKLSVRHGTGSVPECWMDNGDASMRKRIRYETEFNPATFAINLDGVLVENCVDIRYGSMLCDVIKSGTRIDAVVLMEKVGFVALEADAVIDATGDATVCHILGEDMETRSDNRLAYWQVYADGKEVDREESQVALFGELPAYERVYSGIETRDVSAFCIEGRRRINLRNEKATGRIPILISGIPQFRMTRRLIGRSTLMLSDHGRWFDDCVGMIADWRCKGKVYSIPYGMLLPKETNNLWVAGRCVSAESRAGDVIRSIPACSVFGQAAGTAAAMAVKQNLDSGGVCIDALQRRLRQDHVILDKALLQ